VWAVSASARGSDTKGERWFPHALDTNPSRPPTEAAVALLDHVLLRMTQGGKSARVRSWARRLLEGEVVESGIVGDVKAVSRGKRGRPEGA